MLMVKSIKQAYLNLNALRKAFELETAFQVYDFQVSSIDILGQVYTTRAGKNLRFSKKI